MTDKPITPETVRAALEAATPGPWRDFMGDICADGDDIVLAALNRSCGARSSTYTTFKAKNPTAQANARLIAMAPDLATAYLAQAEEIERLRNALFQAGQRLHAVCRSSASKTHIDAACDKWAWECHETAGTQPAVPHILLDEVMPQAREALAAYRATEERG